MGELIDFQRVRAALPDRPQPPAVRIGDWIVDQDGEPGFVTGILYEPGSDRPSRLYLWTLGATRAVPFHRIASHLPAPPRREAQGDGPEDAA